MRRIVNISEDRELLISDLDLSNKIKNILIRYLKVITFGDLLDLDYVVLKHSRGMGGKTLDEIKEFVYDKGYYFRYESIGVDKKIIELNNDSFCLLENYNLDIDVCRLLYKNNIFTLEDLIKYGSGIFRLKGMGGIREEILRKFLEFNQINLIEQKTSNLLENYKHYSNLKTSYGDDEYNKIYLKDVFIEDIGNLYIKLRKRIVSSGINTLYELININYSELKDRLVGVTDLELVELVDFLNGYRLKILDYDQTNVGTSGLKLEEKVEIDITLDDISYIDIQNKIFEKRIERKEELLKLYNDLIARRELLLEKNKMLDLEIYSVINNLKSVSNYERKRHK